MKRSVIAMFGVLAGCEDRVVSNDSTMSFKELSEKSYEYLSARQEEAKAEYRIGEYQRYDWDQETMQLVWSDDGVPKVIADIQFIGSVASQAGTWLWAWANSSVLPGLYQDTLEVKAYGESKGFTKLTEDSWSADETDGWEMTAISAYILQAEGAYCATKKNGFTFMVFSNIRFVDQERLDQSEKK